MFNSKGVNAIEAVYLTMSVPRFKFLMTNLSFDNLSTRAEQINLHKMSFIHELFQKLAAEF